MSTLDACLDDAQVLASAQERPKQCAVRPGVHVTVDRRSGNESCST